MGENKFREICINLVNVYLYETNTPEADTCEVYVVWMCKTLQNNKALLSTDIDGDTRYYEITYNGDKKEFYFDCYIKQENRCILLEDLV